MTSTELLEKETFSGVAFLRDSVSLSARPLSISTAKQGLLMPWAIVP